MPEFENVGQFFQAVADAANGPRHPALQFHATGTLEGGTPSEGGFLVPIEWAVDLLERAYQTGQILGRVNRLPMTRNELRIPTIDESSRAEGSRFGGIAMNWLGEGDEITATKPKFASRQVAAKKLAGLVYTTGELLGDAPALGFYLDRMFALEAGFRVEDAIVAGSGAGTPLGVLNAGCTIDVAKEPTQAADTILAENVVKMWARLWAASKPRAVWLANADVAPQLYGLTWSSGTAVVPLFQYAADGTPLLLGRPVIECEYCSTLGDRGDLILADFGEYILADRTGGLRADLSLHVKFVEDEGAFRFIWRTDGMPAWSSPTTPKNGSSTVGPFVTLAARA